MKYVARINRNNNERFELTDSMSGAYWRMYVSMKESGTKKDEDAAIYAVPDTFTEDDLQDDDFDIYRYPELVSLTGKQSGSPVHLIGLKSNADYTLLALDFVNGVYKMKSFGDKEELRIEAENMENLETYDVAPEETVVNTLIELNKMKEVFNRIEYDI